MVAYYVVIGLAAALILNAAAIYLFIERKFRSIFAHQPSGKTLLDVLSHVPDPGSGPGLHMLAGASLVTGASLFISALLADAFGPPEQLLPNIVSIASLVIAMAFSLVTIWTLWQTRRLDYQAGFKIFDFHDLVHHLSNELEELIRSFDEIYAGRAQPFHRVYLVTTQPFLGRLSYPLHEATRKFLDALRNLTDRRAASLADMQSGKANAAIEFHVICGDSQSITKFHESFFGGSGLSADEIASGIAEVEREITSLNDRVARVGGEGPFHRVSEVPPVQFMVVGNRLFEFTLESQSSMSEIFNTQVVQDTRFCRNYIDTFNVLRRAATG